MVSNLSLNNIICISTIESNKKRDYQFGSLAWVVTCHRQGERTEDIIASAGHSGCDSHPEISESLIDPSVCFQIRNIF